MISYLDKLNLRPSEKRLVVGVAVFVFVLLNFWFVKPHFGDWKKVKATLEKNRATIMIFTNEISKTAEYQKKAEELEGQGSGVLAEEQALHFQREVESQRQRSGVNLISYSAQPTRVAAGATNSFFENQFLTMVVKTGEPELVDFLYNLGAGSSLIRVESMTLNPDPSKYFLNANLTLMASYQKKPKPVLAPPSVAPKTNAPATPKGTSKTNTLSKPISKKN